jgi:alkylhydroperoxidase family enzyme
MPGAKWNGVERVAIASEARAATKCRLCAERRAALSPYHRDGDHDSASTLPLPAIDAVHRIVTDPARLTQAWFQANAATGLSDAAYVEIVGVVACAVAVDSLALALGATPPDLPQPVAGPATGATSSNAVVHSAWVATVPPDAAHGDLADLYAQRLTNRWGFVGNIHRALTLVPAEQVMLTTLLEAMYAPMTLMGGADSIRAISAPQVELIAATVSAANGCVY